MYTRSIDRFVQNSVINDACRPMLSIIPFNKVLII